MLWHVTAVTAAEIVAVAIGGEHGKTVCKIDEKYLIKQAQNLMEEIMTYPPEVVSCQEITIVMSDTKVARIVARMITRVTTADHAEKQIPRFFNYDANGILLNDDKWTFINGIAYPPNISSKNVHKTSRPEESQKERPAEGVRS